MNQKLQSNRDHFHAKASLLMIYRLKNVRNTPILRVLSFERGIQSIEEVSLTANELENMISIYYASLSAVKKFDDKTPSLERKPA